MHNVLPILLVLLAVFTASCIAYIAWELSSDKPVAPESAGGETDADENLS